MCGKTVRSLVLIAIGSIIILPATAQSQTASGKRRNISEDIRNCPFLQQMKDNEWKDEKGTIKNLEDQFFRLDERKDYEIRSTAFNERQYIFALEVTHLELPRWALLIKDKAGGRPLYRYSGLIKAAGYDVDHVALSIGQCSMLNLSANLESEFSPMTRAYMMNKKRIDEIAVSDECKRKHYRKILCGNIPMIPPPLSQMIEIEEEISLIDESLSFELPGGECRPYAGDILYALKELYSYKSP